MHELSQANNYIINSEFCTVNHQKFLKKSNQKIHLLEDSFYKHYYGVHCFANTTGPLASSNLASRFISNVRFICLLLSSYKFGHSSFLRFISMIFFLFLKLYDKNGTTHLPLDLPVGSQKFYDFIRFACFTDFIAFWGSLISSQTFEGKIKSRLRQIVKALWSMT